MWPHLMIVPMKTKTNFELNNVEVKQWCHIFIFRWTIPVDTSYADHLKKEFTQKKKSNVIPNLQLLFKWHTKCQLF